jgi:predicted MFS family arabinose efflux permease
MKTATYKGKIQTLALTLLCQSTHGVLLAGLPLLLPLIRQDLGLNYSQAGILASASLAVYAVMQIPAGYITDHYSPRKLLVIATAGTMGLSALMAISQDFWQLLLIQLFWGFFSSFSFTPAMSIFIGWFSPQRRTTATSLTSVGPSLGVVAVNFIFPVLVSHFNTWRMPFFIFAVAGILFALVLLVWGREAPSKRIPIQFRLQIFREVFQYKQVWMCFGLQFIRFGIVQGIGFWLPSLLVNEKGFPLQLAGIIIGMQGIIGSPCNILGSYFSDRFKKPTLVIGVSLVMLGISTALLVSLQSTALIIVAVLVNAVFVQMYFGPLFIIAVETLGVEKTGISNGVSNTFAICGGLVTAYLMGMLRDSTGSFEWGFYSVCILTVIGLVLTIALEMSRRHKVRDTTISL